MGKIFWKETQGMRCPKKVGIALLLMVAITALSIDCVSAATYHVRGLAAQSVGINGNTNLVAENGVSTDNAAGGTNEYRAITNTTAPSGTSRNRIRFNATTTVTGDERFRAYTPVYATATSIAAGATAHLTAYMRTTGTSASIYAVMYEYNDSTGFVGALKGTTGSAVLSQANSNGQQFDVTFNNPAFTVASGNRVAVVFYATTSSSDVAYLYGAVYNSGTPAGTTYFTVSESAAVTDTTPPTAGAVTITPDISSTYTSAAPTITTVFTDPESALTNCQYTVNGSTWLAGITGGTAPNRTCTASPTGLTGFLNINMRATSSGGGPTTATQIQRTVDATVPIDGTLTVTAGNLQNALSWTAAADTGGSGIASYILRYATGATAPANCATGTAVPGSPFSAATLSTTHSGLTNGTQYSYRLCANDFLGNVSGGVVKSATPVAGPATTITQCGGCHGHPDGPNALVDANRANAAGAFMGSHEKHVSVAADCAKCHTNPTRMDHSDGSININATISGGTYSGGTTVAVSPVSPRTFTTSCNGTTCHGAASPTWGTSTTQASCTKCHGVLNTTPAAYTADPKTASPGYNGVGRDTGGATAATDAQVGAHDTHLRGLNSISNPVVCGECHANVNTTSTAFTGHMDGVGSLNFGTLANSNAAVSAYNATTGACTNTYCHFGKSFGSYAPATASASVTWNNTAYLGGTTADCQKCHLSPPSATGIHAGKAFPASCNTCHSHVSVTGVITDITKHLNGVVDATGGHAFPYPGSLHLVDAGTTPWSSCSCHNTTATGVSYATWAATGRGTAPNCTTCHLGGLKVPSGTSSCWDCHGATATDGKPNGGLGTGIGGSTFPNYSGSHTVHIAKVGLTCTNCHFNAGAGSTGHGNSNGVTKTAATVTFNGLPSTPVWTSPNCTAACHGAAKWGGRLGCINCHSTAQTGTHGTPRDAVTTEFGLAWGHKKSGRGAVTDADCIVCHLEGVFSTQVKSAKHGDGNIDLRDPDGVGEVAITNVSGAAFTFKRFSTSYVAGSRTAAVSNSIADVITQKFCLACHDSNGATNTTARSGAGTAAMPWGGIALGAGYVAAADAIGTQGLVDVKKQFATTNSSVHPVMGPRSKDFPTAARMADPYKPTGTRGTSGTKSDSVVMNCFDCHNTATTPLTTRTVVAHGNAATLRGTTYVNSPTLCLTCHIGTYNSGNLHGAGSAWSTIGSSHTSTVPACQRCHGGNTAATTAPARPRPAQDYHGSNSLYGGGLWPTTNSRPYAFIRAWSGTAYHRPLRSSEFTTGTATCGTGACNNGDQVGDGSTRTYGAGGTY